MYSAQSWGVSAARRAARSDERVAPNHCGLPPVPWRGYTRRMASFLSRLFGGGGAARDAGGPGVAARGQSVEYQGLTIRPVPERAGGQWRLAGVIVKQTEAGALERTFLRSDLFGAREDAESFAVTKAKQIIDERGESLFADGAKSGRA